MQDVMLEPVAVLDCLIYFLNDFELTSEWYLSVDDNAFSRGRYEIRF